MKPKLIQISDLHTTDTVITGPEFTFDFSGMECIGDSSDTLAEPNVHEYMYRSFRYKLEDVIRDENGEPSKYLKMELTYRDIALHLYLINVDETYAYYTCNGITEINDRD